MNVRTAGNNTEKPPAATDESPQAQPGHSSACEVLPGTAGLSVPVLALIVLAVIVFIYALQRVREFVIPVVFGVFISYTLTPLIRGLERMRIPCTIGTTLVVLTILLGTALAANSLRGQFGLIIGQLPAATEKSPCR